MRDYNFFDPYLSGGRRSVSDNSTAYAVVIIVAALVIGAWPVYNIYLSADLKRQVQELETAIIANPNNALLAQVSALDTEVNQTTARLSTALAVDKELTAGEWLTAPMLASLTSVIPRDVAIDSIALSGDRQVQLSGSATNKPAIAELQLNLRRTERFEQLYISSITLRSGTREESYVFSLTLRVKEVALDASDK